MTTPMRSAPHRRDVAPAPFTTDDFVARMSRAARSAAQAGLAGVLVTPGPDLLYLSGYAPIAITERITLLVVSADREPKMIIPTLERPDAEAAPSAARLTIVDWQDGTNPYAAAADLLDPKGRYAISDSAWSMHLLGLLDQLPDSQIRVHDRSPADAAGGQGRR
jgi:D-alanyl-D-alanine dipeptidase